MQSTPSNAQYSFKKVQSYWSRTNTISNMYKVNAMLNFSAKLANEISEIDVRQFWLKLIFCSNKVNGQTCTTNFDAVQIEMSYVERQILVALLIYFKTHFIFREFPWIFRVVTINGTAICMANGKMNADNGGAPELCFARVYSSGHKAIYWDTFHLFFPFVRTSYFN